MGAGKTDDFFPNLQNPEGTRIINERCLIRTQDEHRVVLVEGVLQVTEKELRVTLAAQSSLHRTRAIAELCKELNSTQTLFPGSRLRLCYAIRKAA